VVIRSRPVVTVARTATRGSGVEPAVINGQMAAVDLYWLPLGAGGHSVRLNGFVFEAIAPRLQHRGRTDLCHSALAVYVPDGRFVIERPDTRPK